MEGATASAGSFKARFTRLNDDHIAPSIVRNKSQRNGRLTQILSHDLYRIFASAFPPLSPLFVVHAPGNGSTSRKRKKSKI